MPAGPGVRLIVDTTSALYPITIDPLATTPNWTAESDQAFAYFGGSVGTAGDVNGDGYADVIVGAVYYDNGQTDEGRAFVYHGSASGLSMTPNWTAESDQAGASFGGSVGTAGDVNGDGYADVIVGANGYDNDQTEEGRAFVYHGSAGSLGLPPSIALITYRGPDQGMALVAIDGLSQGTLDLYSPTPQYQYLQVYSVASGFHQLEVRALDQKNPLSSGTEVRVDAFQFSTGTVEDNGLGVRYNSWTINAGPFADGGSAHQTATPEASVYFSFTGTRFTWITARGPDAGQAEVIVNDVVVATVDLYSPNEEWLYRQVITGLTGGSHTVQIRVLGTHNPASTGDTVVFDGYSSP